MEIGFGHPPVCSAISISRRVVFAASGQVFTAVTRRLLLGKTMTGGQTLGVSCMALG